MQTQSQAHSLCFVRASLTSSTLPYKFTYLDGGHFCPGNRYGSITRKDFCAVGIVAKETGDSHEDSDDEGSSNSEESDDQISDKEEKLDQEDRDKSKLNHVDGVDESSLPSQIQELSHSSLTQLEISSQHTLESTKNGNCYSVYSQINTFFSEKATPFLSLIYTGLTCYKYKDGDWMVTFFVVKDLNALLKVKYILCSC